MARKQLVARRKHVPMRTCVVCREAKPKRELTRLVGGEDQSLRLDPSGKLAGRGAYLCDRAECWQRAARGKALDRALRTELREEARALLEARAVELELNETTSRVAGDQGPSS